MKNLKIARKNFPFPSPIPFTLSSLAFLKAFNCPEWAWGVCYALIALVWIGFFFSIAEERHVDIFENADQSDGKSFAERFKKAMAEKNDER